MSYLPQIRINEINFYFLNLWHHILFIALITIHFIDLLNLIITINSLKIITHFLRAINHLNSFFFFLIIIKLYYYYDYFLI